MDRRPRSPSRPPYRRGRVATGGVGCRDAVRCQHRLPGASKPARGVCSARASPWPGGLHAHLVPAEREKSLSLQWLQDKLWLTVRGQVAAIVTIEYRLVADHHLARG